MAEERESEWSEAERRALESLRRDESPPPELERRVVETLGARGLLRRAATPADRRPWLAAAAVFAAGLLVGWFLGRTGLEEAPTAAAVEARSTAPIRFLLLLYEDERYRSPEPGHERERVEEYGRWVGELARDGRLAGGDELAAEGVLLEPPAGAGEPPVHAGVPRAEVGTLAGYFTIEARDLGEAREIAATCPHLRYGGSISVRPISS